MRRWTVNIVVMLLAVCMLAYAADWIVLQFASVVALRTARWW